MSNPIDIEIAETVEPELLSALARLIPQLSSSAPIPSADQLREILASPGTTLLIARDRDEKGRVVGTLTLVVFRIPAGVRAWIEDVIVDVDSRGKGVGEALSRRALEIAASRGARTVELTSRPTREAANRLYRRLGFEPRDTNVYRYTVSGPKAPGQ